MSSRDQRKRIVIMGAGGRDFHNFNLVFRDDPVSEVIAFTAAQIPFQEDRRYPAALAGALYPEGIPILDERALPSLIADRKAEEIVFAYSDVSHQAVMMAASRVLAMGADFRLLGPEATMLAAAVPVISVCAVRTGCGKSPVTRHLCRLLLGTGRRPVVVRHPMAYGRLDIRAFQCFRTAADLDRFECTLEEREEFEPLIALGIPLFAGVDYGQILEEAEKAGDVLLWDGGNNDFPFFRPDLEIVLADPLRAGDETTYFPGLVNLMRADAVVVTKADTATVEELSTVERNIASCNPEAKVVRGELEVSVAAPEKIAGKRVTVVEDGPTLTHGGMGFGAGTVAARRFAAAEILDPRPYAAGSLARVYREYPHLERVVPAMGYSDSQIEDLRATLEAVPGDIIVNGSPVQLDRLMRLSRPVVQVGYEFREEGGHRLQSLVLAFLEKGAGDGR